MMMGRRLSQRAASEYNEWKWFRLSVFPHQKDINIIIMMTIIIKQSECGWRAWPSWEWPVLSDLKYSSSSSLLSECLKEHYSCFNPSLKIVKTGAAQMKPTCEDDNHSRIQAKVIFHRDDGMGITSDSGSEQMNHLSSWSRWWQFTIHFIHP